MVYWGGEFVAPLPAGGGDSLLAGGERHPAEKCVCLKEEGSLVITKKKRRVPQRKEKIASQTGVQKREGQNRKGERAKPGSGSINTLDRAEKEGKDH